MNKRINQSELPKSKLTSLNATSLECPKIVKIGIFLFFVVFLLVVINLLFNSDYVLALVKQKISNSINNINNEETIQIAQRVIYIRIFINAIFLIVNGLIYWFIYKGKNWARITIAALKVGGFAIFVPIYVNLFNISMYLVIFNLFIYAISFSSVLCFFTPKANVWFAAIKNSRNECIAE